MQVVRIRSVIGSKDDTAIVVFEAVGGLDSESYHATVRVPAGDVIELTEERRSARRSVAGDYTPAQRRWVSELESVDGD